MKKIRIIVEVDELDIDMFSKHMNDMLLGDKWSILSEGNSS